MKKIAFVVEVPEDTDIFSLHEELSEAHPDWEETLVIYENLQALHDNIEEGE